MKNQHQCLNVINFFFTFLYSGVGILLPLYLLERGFSLHTVGLILAIMPPVFMVTRIIFAAIADIIGTRNIFIVHGFARFLSIAAYILANNPFMFGAGKFLEGINLSGFFSVVRTEAYQIAGKGEGGKFAAFMLGMRNFGDFAGMLFAGFLISKLNFTDTFTIFMIISLIVIYASFRIHPKSLDNKATLKKIKGEILYKRKRKYWIGSVIAAIASIPTIPIMFLFPVYLAHVLGFETWEVANTLLVYPLVYGITILLSTKKNIGFNNLALGALLLAAIPYFFLTSANGTGVLLLVAVIAAGKGLGGNIFENVLYKSVGGSKAVSTDISVLFVPYRIVEFASLALAGFAVEMFGFGIVFSTIGTFMALFLLIAWLFLKNKI